MEPLDEEAASVIPEVREESTQAIQLQNCIEKVKNKVIPHNIHLVICPWKWSLTTSTMFLCYYTKMLEDSVFLKRHAKLELDEKRRKRYKWVLRL